jgi:hypothetical protein
MLLALRAVAVAALWPPETPTEGGESMKGIFVVIGALALTGAALAASWETTSMRTPSGGLVRIGMTSGEVLKELGQPRHTRNSRRGAKNESWTYRGTDGLYVITFSSGRVVRIMVTPDRN